MIKRRMKLSMVRARKPKMRGLKWMPWGRIGAIFGGVEDGGIPVPPV
jgi:hypothetical protein